MSYVLNGKVKYSCVQTRTLILSIAVGAVIAMNFCNYGCLNYRRSLGEALIIDGLKLKNRTNKFRKNPDEHIPKKSGRKKSEQNFRRKKNEKKLAENLADRVFFRHIKRP